MPYNQSMRVTVGVTGGIAAYKAAELVRALQRQALEVHVVMTAAACTCTRAGCIYTTPRNFRLPGTALSIGRQFRTSYCRNIYVLLRVKVRISRPRSVVS